MSIAVRCPRLSGHSIFDGTHWCIAQMSSSSYDFFSTQHAFATLSTPLTRLLAIVPSHLQNGDLYRETLHCSLTLLPISITWSALISMYSAARPFVVAEVFSTATDEGRFQRAWEVVWGRSNLRRDSEPRTARRLRLVSSIKNLERCPLA